MTVIPPENAESCSSAFTAFTPVGMSNASSPFTVLPGLMVIQARLGHATITETMDTYGHLFPDSEDIGRGAIDAMLTSADVRQMCATGQS